MQLVVLSYPTFFTEEIPVLVQLFEAGLELFHLRKHEATRDELEQFIEAIPAKYYARIVVHQHYEMVDKYGLRGIHLNRHTTSDFRPQSGTVSTSLHTLEEVKKITSPLDYAFLSPIFDSVSKKVYKSKFQDHLALEQTVSNSKVPIYALGGMSTCRVAQVGSLGFKGSVVLGNIWEPAALEQDVQTTLTNFHVISNSCRSCAQA